MLIAIYSSMYILNFHISNIFTKLVMVNVIPVIDTLSWMLQLYAVTYVTRFCYKYDTELCTHHKFCRRKIARVLLITTGILSIIIINVLISLTFVNKEITSVDLIILRYTGNFPLEIFVESLHSIISFAMATFLYKYKSVGIYLFVGYLLRGGSELLQIINITINSAYSQIGLIYTLEWALATVGMIIIFWEVKKLFYYDSH